MAKNLFTFPCPCCGKMVEVDTLTGKARAVRAEEAKGGQNLDSLLQAHQKESQRLDSLFDSAKGVEKSAKDRLDAQLRRAKEEAKKDKDKDQRPPSIFDLD